MNGNVKGSEYEDSVRNNNNVEWKVCNDPVQKCDT